MLLFNVAHSIINNIYIEFTNHNPHPLSILQLIEYILIIIALLYTRQMDQSEAPSFAQKKKKL